MYDVADSFLPLTIVIERDEDRDAEREILFVEDGKLVGNASRRERDSIRE